MQQRRMRERADCGESGSLKVLWILDRKDRPDDASVNRRILRRRNQFIKPAKIGPQPHPDRHAGNSGRCDNDRSGEREESPDHPTEDNSSTLRSVPYGAAARGAVDADGAGEGGGVVAAGDEDAR